MKKSIVLTLSSVILFSVTSKAEDTQEIYQQEKTVVTASRYQQSEDDVIPSVSVIDRDDILNLQANNILDVLSLQQGIDVARNGGNGAATSVFMRGTNSNHVLVLIDGMRASSAFTGSFTWEHLPISQVERIEIVRGTRVSYYGSDAIGGVINIITRKQDNLYVRYTAGSYDTHNFDVGYGNSSENSHYSIIIGSQKTDGFSATNANNTFGFNPDDDGYTNLSINLKGSTKLTNGKLSFNYIETRADIDFDSFFNVGNSDTSERVTRLLWNGQLFNDWDTELAVGNNKNSLETIAFSNRFESERYSFDWLMNKNFNTNHFGFGLSYRKEDSVFHHTVINFLNYNDSRNNLAAFINWRGDFGKNTFSMSGRFDHNSVYGSDSSADFDWAYQATDKLRLNLSTGTAFHAPSLSELFSPRFQLIAYSPILDQFVNFFSFEGNPDLKPEESVNYEAGLKLRLNERQNLSVNLFYYKIDNLVDFRGSTFRPINVNESTIKGLEASYNYRLGDINFNLNATVQDANNDETDTPLLRRPDNKINLSIDKFYDKFSIGSSIRYASKNPDFGVELNGYTVFDLRAAYAFNNHWKLSAKLENATDKNYQVINGFNTAGASGYLTIEWQQ